MRGARPAVGRWSEGSERFRCTRGRREASRAPLGGTPTNDPEGAGGLPSEAETASLWSGGLEQGLEQSRLAIGHSQVEQVPENAVESPS